ncbi:trans-1,2-dihydrobenzene-1,2-diol dehydrogenase-like isoform X1 [Haliotis rufescens]|uniref:trans-1,2-dihydrobenzene-1,2-diol dehydrogenase-like isoform X1 n=2 Tax=Haliotis rufescens TaxID=6454 RepID=UPI00201EC460|nr:trans-1,2-dihydrobenzene-1,2-diol dehydrogenase-like isoform X1 [Haliotis rufescens]
MGNETMATRWGFCGAGRICEDFCATMVTLPREEHKLMAIADTFNDNAELYAQKFNIEKVYESYEDMADDPDIDVVYIATINPDHHRLCLIFLKADKHVLCEKPMTLTLAGCEELLKVAKEKKLFFMEGEWSRCFPVYDQIRKELDSGSLGDVKLIQTSICMSGYQCERVEKRALGGGGLKDIGCYTIQAALLAFKGMPTKIVAEVDMVDNGEVDAGGSVILCYPGGRMAVLTYHTHITGADNSLHILGTRGSIHVEAPFWIPTKVRTPNGDYEFPLPDSGYNYNYEYSSGFVYEQNAVRDCLKKGLTENPVITHAESRTIAAISDEILRQFGIQYDSP